MDVCLVFQDHNDSRDRVHRRHWSYQDFDTSLLPPHYRHVNLKEAKMGSQGKYFVRDNVHGNLDTGNSSELPPIRIVLACRQFGLEENERQRRGLAVLQRRCFYRCRKRC